MKNLFNMALACLLILTGCGDDPSGPEGDPTASVLELEFTGETDCDSRDRVSLQLTERDRDVRGLLSSYLELQGICQVTASWSVCPDTDFLSYVLYRSTSPGISENPDEAQVLCTCTDCNQNSFVDDNLNWETRYYYVLRTANAAGNHAWSNEDSLTTPSEGTPPTPSTLSVQFSGDSRNGRTRSESGSVMERPATLHSVNVRNGSTLDEYESIMERPAVLHSGSDACQTTAMWTRCPDGDFASYTLYRSLYPSISGDTTSAENLGKFTTADDTIFTDTGVTWETTYYYALVTRNTGSGAAWSNECSLTIPSEEIVVTDPNSSTVWEYEQTGTTVSWSGAVTDYIRIELWQGSAMVGDYSGWVSNTGTYTRLEALSSLWVSGSDYYIRVIDQNDNSDMSESFLIEETIDVTEPNSSTVWEIGDVNTQVVWSGGGAQVKLEVWYDGVYVTDFSGWITNTESYTRSAPIPTTWGIGLYFSIRVVDSGSTPVEGFSEEFQIYDEIDVTQPDLETVWAWDQEDVTIEWNEPYSDSVCISVYKGGSYIGTFSGWVPNTGSYTRDTPIPSAWDTGEDYTVKVEGILGSTGFSDEFSIWAMAITEPDSSTVWTHDQTDSQVLWVPGPGSNVRMEVCQGGTKVDDYCSWTPDDGEYTRTEAIPEIWGAGTDFRIKMIDDLDNVAWSSEFTIIESYPDSVIATVAVGVNPGGICSLPSGEYVYVINHDDDNASIIRTSDNTVVATVAVGAHPNRICSLPSGEYVYVTNHFDGGVTVIRTSDNTIVSTVAVGPDPIGICSLPSGEYVYVANYTGGNVSVIRTSDNAVVATVSVGSTPWGVCSLPSGQYVYVTNTGNNTVSVIRTSDNTVVTTVEVGSYPIGICSLPSGEYVYVANHNDDTVSVIRTSDNMVVATVVVGFNPHAICSLPSGEYVYVPNYSDYTVSVIRTLDNTVVATVGVGVAPVSICSLPSGEYLYVANSNSNTVSVIH